MFSACTTLGDQALYTEQDVAQPACGVPDPVPDTVAAVFSNRCGGAGCHTSGGAAGGLMLDPDVAAANLVGVLAQGQPGATLVVAGASDSSYLIQKMTGAVQPIMPLGAPGPLPDSELGPIRAWIDALPPCDTGGGNVADTTQPDTTQPDTGTPSDSGPGEDVTIPEVVVPEPLSALFQNTCGGGGCHIQSSVAGLSLLPKSIVSNTVLVKANNGQMNRIEPGNPEQSWLWRKVTGAEGSGSKMPIGQPAWTPDEIKLLEDWINSIDALTGAPSARPTEDTGQPPPSACMPSSDTFRVTYADVFQLVQARCAPCHIDDSSGGLNMKGDNFLTNTIGVPAVANSQQLRIAPGAPDQSYLVLKLKGDAGSQMPLGDALNEAEIQMVELWIEDCASPKAEQGASTRNL